jgi:NAD(P)-dependent dehydrogenase (short-subunit alcohol dehydrogenase family)
MARVAIVTGGTRGIGEAISVALKNMGVTVAANYMGNDQRAKAFTDRTGIKSYKWDVSDFESCQAGVRQVESELGPVDILVNNAGENFPLNPLADISLDEWRAMFRDNLESMFLCTQAAAAVMRDRGGGAIVNIASISATNPATDHSHYNSAKAGVVMFTRSCAQELGPFGIRVNAVSPGLIHKPGIEKGWPEGVGRWRSRAPLRRLGEPEDIADACLFLASPAARWISGQNLGVDGGMLATRIY